MDQEEFRRNQRITDVLDKDDIVDLMQSLLNEQSRINYEQEQSKNRINSSGGVATVTSAIVVTIGLFGSYMLYWKENIEQTKDMMNDINNVIINVDDMRQDVNTNEDTLNLLQNDVSYAIREINEIKKDAKEHQKYDDSHHNIRK